MGAWSTHPLGNDRALDTRAHFFQLANIPQDVREKGEPFSAEHVAALVAVLPQIDEEERYVLPWLIHDTHTQIADPKLSATIKGLIASTPEEYEAKPGDPPTDRLIANLTRHWDGMMSGKTHFEAVPSDEGVFAAIFSAMSKKKPDEKTGLINRRPKQS